MKLSLLFPKEELDRLKEVIKLFKGQELIIDDVVYRLKTLFKASTDLKHEIV